MSLQTQPNPDSQVVGRLLFILTLPLALLAGCGAGSDGGGLETPQRIIVGGPGRTALFGHRIAFGLPSGVLPQAVALTEDGRMYASFLEGALLVGTFQATKSQIDSGARVVGLALKLADRSPEGAVLSEADMDAVGYEFLWLDRID